MLTFSIFSRTDILFPLDFPTTLLPSTTDVRGQLTPTFPEAALFKACYLDSQQTFSVTLKNEGEKASNE